MVFGGGAGGVAEQQRTDSVGKFWLAKIVGGPGVREAQNLPTNLSTMTRMAMELEKLDQVLDA
jgi:hypothetical protein